MGIYFDVPPVMMIGGWPTSTVIHPGLVQEMTANFLDPSAYADLQLTRQKGAFDTAFNMEYNNYLNSSGLLAPTGTTYIDPKIMDFLA